jgi:hypothetical protein
MTHPDRIETTEPSRRHELAATQARGSGAPVACRRCCAETASVVPLTGTGPALLLVVGQVDQRRSSELPGSL